MNPGSYFTKLPKHVCLLILLAAILRLGWGLSRPSSAESLQALPDQVEYLSLAQNLIHGQGFSFIDPRFNDRVYAFRTPGYPMVLAACGANVQVVRTMQALLDTSTVLAVFLLARRMLPDERTRPFIAAVIVAFNPLLIYFSGLLLSETLFVAMLTWGMLLTLAGFAAAEPDERNAEQTRSGKRSPQNDRARFRAWGLVGSAVRLGIYWRAVVLDRLFRGRKSVRRELGNFSWHRASARCPTAVFGTKTPPGRAVPRKIPKPTADPTRTARGYFVALTGGVILALAVLVRPSAAFLPLLLGIGAVVANRRQATAYQLFPKPRMFARRLLLAGATMCLLVALVLTPWALRNVRALHHLIWTDTNAGFTLYDGYNANATGASDQSFIKEMPILRTLDEFGRSKYLADRARDFAAANPLRVLKLIVIKAARTWSPMPLSGQFGGTLYRAALLSYSAPFDLLVLWGLWKGNLKRSSKVFLLLPAIYLTAVHAMTIGSLRYRVPAEPALAVLAACAWDWTRRPTARA